MSHRVLLTGPDLRQTATHARMLAERGCEVRTAATGLGCLQVLRNWEPDIMVMDPDLYWGSGMGVLGMMYEEADIATVPVVLLVDDSARVKAELKPEWPCRLLPRSITSASLFECIDGMLYGGCFIRV